MADTVSTKVLTQGNHRYVVRFSNISDGTGEADVTKVDRSALAGPQGVAPSALRVDEIWYDVQGFEAVRIEWNDTASGPADEILGIFAGDGYRDYRPYGGLQPASKASDVTGAVGDILFTTVNGAGAATDTYNITISFTLKE